MTGTLTSNILWILTKSWNICIYIFRDITGTLTSNIFFLTKNFLDKKKIKRVTTGSLTSNI